VDIKTFQRAVSAACERVIAAEQNINAADSLVGDGDCGTTLARGASAVLHFLTTSRITADASSTLLALTSVIEDSMDGTSRAIYSLFFVALASFLRASPEKIVDAKLWAAAGTNALAQLQQVTPARQGDRTLMDTLEPFVRSFGAGESFS